MKSKVVTFRVSIDGTKLSITEHENSILIFLTDRGFFREISPSEFLSLSPSLANRLNRSYISSSVSSDVIPFDSSSESSLSLGSIPNLKPSAFLNLMLSYILRIYFSDLNQSNRSPSTSEGA